MGDDLVAEGGELRVSDLADFAEGLYLALVTLAFAIMFENILVPRPVEGLTTSRELTMEFVEGRNLREFLKIRKATSNKNSMYWPIFGLSER